MSKVGESLLRCAREALEYAKGNKKIAKAHKVRVYKKLNISSISYNRTDKSK